MKTLRRAVGRITTTLTVAVGVVFAMTSAAYAQSPAPDDTGPDIFGNMPGAVILLVPIVLGGAWYVSRRLGPQTDDESTRREGAVSRTLARSKRK